MTHSHVAQPPLACANCAIGNYTVYGAAKDSAPNDVYIRRRSVQLIAAKKTFLREGEIAPQICTIYSGWAFQFKQTTDGRRHILSFLLPGDVVSLESLCFPHLPLPFGVKSLTRLSVCTFALSDMLELTQNSSERVRCFENMVQANAAALSRRQLDLGRRSALGRVSQLILEIEERLRRRHLVEDDRFFFPARQEHIADALGLTSVYVSRTLDRLRREQVIDLDRMYLSILDIEKLRAIAEDE